MLVAEKLKPHKLVQRISEDDLNSHIKTIGTDIAIDYAGMDVTFLSIWYGAKQFNELSNRVIQSSPRRPKHIINERIRVKSYGANTESNGDPRIVLWPRNPKKNFRGKDVLIKDDIADTKLTIARVVIPYVMSFQPNSVQVATMLTKTSHYDKQAADVDIKYHGPDIDYFALGTGLDVDEYYRYLKGIWELIWD
jgi:hypoxanthine phosphoribosyltransferase